MNILSVSPYVTFELMMGISTCEKFSNIIVLHKNISDYDTVRYMYVCASLT